MTAPILHDDFRDLLELLLVHEVRFLVVGAHALAVHGVPRATGDLDLFVEPSAENSSRLVSALEEFGAPLAAHGVSAGDFEGRGTVYQLGVPPRRIDLMTSIDGVTFEEADRGRVVSTIDNLQVPVLGRAELLANKLASGRTKDLADAEVLSAEDQRGQ